MNHVSPRPLPAATLAARRTMLRWSLVGVGAAAGLSMLLGLLLSRLPGLLGALVAAFLVVAFFVSGHMAEGFTMQYTDAIGMMITVVAFLTRIGLFGALLWVVVNVAPFDALLSHLWLATGTLAATIGWVVGLMTGHHLARIPTYDKQYQVREVAQ